MAGADAEKDRPEIEHQDQAIRFGDSGQNVADANGERLQRQRQQPSGVGAEQRDAGDTCRRDIKSGVGGTLPDGLSAWMDEPRDIPRVATGVKQRAARLKGLGNAIVPQIAMQIGLTIKAVEHG